MNPLTWQNPEQLFVAQVLKKIFYNSVAELRENKIVRLFLDMGFGFSTYKEKHVDSVNGFEIGVKPGLAVKLNDNFSFITKVGFAGYRDDYYRGEENGFGVGLDGENISIGIEYEF